MPFWLVIIIIIVNFLIWPGIVVVLHICEERRIKKNKSEQEKGTDRFLNKIKKDGK